MTAASVARGLLDAYRSQDRAAAEALVAGDFRFTSPQDDRIDRAAYFERCFPTAHRFSRQDLLELVETADGTVLLRYEYDLADGGGTFRNVEAVTVRDGLVREVQVYFGGAVHPTAS